MFVSSCDGCLYDTRVPDWHKKPPLRPNFKVHHRDIETVADLKATLRAGAFTSLGSYPLFFHTSDGGALKFSTVRDELRQVIWSIQNKCNDGWRVIGCQINYENNDLYDDHTGDKIESAYGDDENAD